MPRDIAEYVRRSCAASGVPERLEDIGVAAHVAEILTSTEVGALQRVGTPAPTPGSQTTASPVTTTTPDCGPAETLQESLNGTE